MSIESEIDAMIRGLGATDAPTGLEARVLDGLRNADAARADGWLSMGAAVAVCGCALAVAAVTATRSGSPNKMQSPAATTHTAVSMAQAQIAAGIDPVAPAEASVGAHFPPAPVSAPVRERVLVSRQRDAAAAPSAVQSEDARAMANMLAPSMPEPPEPLTRQERLLLRVARTSEAPALAAESLTAHAEQQQRDEQVQQDLALLGQDMFADTASTASPL